MGQEIQCKARVGKTVASGTQAAKWADKIKNPKSLVDKLGVKAGMRASVVAIGDDDFLKDLHSRTSDITIGKPAKDSDLIFFGAESNDALEKLPGLSRSLKPNGAIWVVYPKGQKNITESSVFAAESAPVW